jgi:hypothetical protein
MRAPPEGYLTFDSAAEAARQLDRYLNIPVVIPSPLPPGTSLQAKKGAWVSAYGGRGTAEIRLHTDEGILILDYGASGFDGCGGDDADVVWIHGKRGLITADHYGRRPWSQVVWPVKPGHVDGTYGVTGNVSRAEALALARSMQVAIDAANGPDPGC